MTTLPTKNRRGQHFTPEHQRRAQAARSYESLAQAGRKGYEALVMRHGVEFVQQNAAKWRRKHPNRYERAVMEWLEDHGIDYQRDVMIEGVRYCDFVLTYRGIIIEVDGPIWHTNNALHGEDREGRDKRQDKILTDAGWKIIRISTKGINLDKQLGEQI